MERWSIQVDKQNLKFSAAQFLIFPDGSAERLHGHNYRVFVEVEGPLCPHGLVLDFIKVKPIVQSIVDGLDEHWLIPGTHPELTAELKGSTWDIRYRERVYQAPEEDVIVLPINNSSAENLAAWIADQFRSDLGSTFPECVPDRVRVAVEETPGQRGIYEWSRD